MRKDLASGRRREKAHHWLPDPFDPDQDIEDEITVRCGPYVCPESGSDCLILFTCNLGDANRLLSYLLEKFPDQLVAVLEGETFAAVRVERGAEERSRVMKQMFLDVMLEKKCDRFYPCDRVFKWTVDWPVQICNASNIWDMKESKFRLMAAPRKLENEFVVAVDEFCKWSNRSDVPYFSPQDFTHCVSVFHFETPGKEKLLGWAIVEKDLVYLKPSTKNPIKEDKVSRAYFKLFEALERFKIVVPAGGKAIDVGASPGGWTQCLVERGLKVWAVDPALLTLKEDVLKNVVWLAGLSTSSEVLQRLKSDGPFDVLVCDMNQLPDELARSFDNMVDLLAPGAVMVITIKLSHLRPEQRQVRKFSKGSNRMVKYMLQTHPCLRFEGIKWLLQNKNERCVVFRKAE